MTTYLNTVCANLPSERWFIKWLYWDTHKCPGTFPKLLVLKNLGGNDIGVGPNRWTPQRIATKLIQICWHFHNVGNNVSLVLVEPRNYFSDAYHKHYRKEADAVNRHLKRYSWHTEAPYHTINFSAVPFQRSHTIDGTHFRPVAIQHIIAKFRNVILWQKEQFDNL